MYIVNFFLLTIALSIAITFIYSFVTKSDFCKYFIGFFIFYCFLLYFIINRGFRLYDEQMLYLFSITTVLYIITFPFIVNAKRVEGKIKIIQRNFVVCFVLFGFIMYMSFFNYTQAKVIAPYFVNIIYFNEIQHNKELFNQAINYVNQKDYEMALKIADNLSDELPFSKLSAYLEARKIYDENDSEIVDNVWSMLKHNFDDSYRSLNADEFFCFDALPQEIEDFEKEVEKRKEYFEALRKIAEFGDAPPYVGMREENLYYTSWGKPYRIETNSDSPFRGERAYAFYYFSYVYKGKRYAGRVMVDNYDGEVVDVSDGRTYTDRYGRVIDLSDNR